MTLRSPLHTRRWESDPLGISRRSQDGIRNNLLETTLRSQDTFLRRTRIELGRPPDPIQLIDRFQANNLVLTTLSSQDELPVGKQQFARQDLGPPQPVRGALGGSRGSSPQPIPAGDQSYALPPSLPRQPVLAWAQNLLLSTLAVAAAFVPLPVSTEWWTLPRDAPSAPAGIYNNLLLLTTLAGQDASLVGDQLFALPQRAVQPNRSYTQSPPIPLTLASVRPVGRQQYDLPPPPPWYRQAQNSFLAYEYIDQFFGEPGQVVNYDWSLPISAGQFNRSHSWSGLTATLAAIPPKPFAQYDWPTPRVAQRIDESWARNLVLATLAGQDATLVGDQVSTRQDLGPVAAQPDRFYSWSGQTSTLPDAASVNVVFRSPLFTAQWAYGSAVISPSGSPTVLLTAVVANPVPFNQYDWALPKLAARIDESWTLSLVGTTLAGQDASLAGGQYTARPPLPSPVPTGEVRGNLQLTTLAGQDAQLAGDQSSALPKTAAQPDRFQAYNLVLTTLAAPSGPPPGKQRFELPGRAPRPGVGQWYHRPPSDADVTAAPPGHQWFDLPGGQPQLGFGQWYHRPAPDDGVVTANPFNQYDWPVPRVALQFVRSATYNLILTTLAGRDATLAGDQWFANPPPGPQQFVRSAVSQTPIILFTANPVPFNQYDWPVPRAALRIDESWAQSLVATTLAGKDAKLVGRQLFDTPPSGSSQVVRSWTWPAPVVLFTANPVPFNQYDWPNPKVAGRIDETWTQALVTTTLAGQDARLPGRQLSDSPPLGPSQFTRSWVSPTPIILFTANPVPFNQYDWPLPKIAARIDESWTRALVTTTLAGQDARLAGAQVYDLPRAIAPPVPSWTRNVQIQFAILAVPFAQYDWALPKSPPQPDRFQSGTLVLSTLLGKDATLAGDQLFARPEPGPYQFVRTADRNLVLTTLSGQDARLVGKSAIDPPPTGPLQFVRRWEWSAPLSLYVPVLLPFNQYEWPTPKIAGRIDESWAQNLLPTTLAGRDARLVGKAFFDLPPPPLRFIQMWNWPTPVVFPPPLPPPFSAEVPLGQLIDAQTSFFFSGGLGPIVNKAAFALRVKGGQDLPLYITNQGLMAPLLAAPDHRRDLPPDTGPAQWGVLVAGALVFDFSQTIPENDDIVVAMMTVSAKSSILAQFVSFVTVSPVSGIHRQAAWCPMNPAADTYSCVIVSAGGLTRASTITVNSYGRFQIGLQPFGITGDGQFYLVI